MGRATRINPVNPATATEGNPFGKPAVIVHLKEDGGSGISADANTPKHIQSDYVEPMQRTNPEYLQKLADDKILSDIEAKEKREKALKAFGHGQARIVGASPNAPYFKPQTVF